MRRHPLFANRVGVIATMHCKERVIAPILEEELGINWIVPKGFNTDSFGTFTREVERVGTQVEAAKLKAENALLLTGETLALSSEGAFGPHPDIPFLPCNREIVFLLDKIHNIEIFGQEISTETNYSHDVIDNLQQAYDFGLKVGFPEHGLVIINECNCQTRQPDIIKGITTSEALAEAVSYALTHSSTGKVRIETDMRAMYNPTRMNNIAKATRDLIKKIYQTCPNCSWPGFELIERKKGLPCAYCNLPTAITRSAVYQCKKCYFSQEILFPDGLEKAEPSQCMYCNP